VGTLGSKVMGLKHHKEHFDAALVGEIYEVLQVRLAISRNLHVDTFCDRRVWMKGVARETLRG
jgi:hypothetical protein